MYTYIKYIMMIFILSMGISNINAFSSINDVDINIEKSSNTSIDVFEDFENGAIDWSNNTVTQTEGNATDFLGRFSGTKGDEGIFKTFDLGLTNSGKVVKIEFDMYEIDSWDDEQFIIFINGIEVSSDYMSHYNRTWSKNATDLEDGGIPIDNVGNSGKYYLDNDEKHHYIVEGKIDKNGKVKLGFGATINSGLSDESYGIDNVSISIIPDDIPDDIPDNIIINDYLNLKQPTPLYIDLKIDGINVPINVSISDGYVMLNGSAHYKSVVAKNNDTIKFYIIADKNKVVKVKLGGIIKDIHISILGDTSKTKDLLESENMYGFLGEVIDDVSAEGGKAVKATVGTEGAGTMQFGPYVTDLFTGTAYTVNFRLKVLDNTSLEKIAMLDVYDYSTGLREYREIRATDFTTAGEYQNFGLNFIKPESSNIEYRIFYYDKVDLWSDKVILEVNTDTTTLPDYESENLANIVGKVIVDNDASANLALEALVSDTDEGTIQFGPYDATNLVDGETYKATFRLKVKNNTFEKGIGVIDVYNGDLDYRELLEIKGTDFTSNDNYQDFTINFVKIAGSKNYEYRLFFYDNQDITIDKVSITK